jgi:hypothetical protein
MTEPIRHVLGIMNDRVLVEQEQGSAETEQLTLYVNGGGQLLALTEEQFNQRQTLSGRAAKLAQAQAQTDQPEQPLPGSLAGYQQTSGESEQ